MNLQAFKIIILFIVVCMTLGCSTSTTGIARSTGFNRIRDNPPFNQSVHLRPGGYEDRIFSIFEERQNFYPSKPIKVDISLLELLTIDSPDAYGAVYGPEFKPDRWRGDALVSLIRRTDRYCNDFESGSVNATARIPDAGVSLSADSYFVRDAYVSSYIIHFDPPGDSRNVFRQGSICFNAPILGVIVQGTTLNDSDQVCKPDNFPLDQYPRRVIQRGVDWGFEDDHNDKIWFESNGHRLFFWLESSGVGIDQIRVITAGRAKK